MTPITFTLGLSDCRALAKVVAARGWLGRYGWVYRYGLWVGAFALGVAAGLAPEQGLRGLKLVGQGWMLTIVALIAVLSALTAFHLLVREAALRWTFKNNPGGNQTFKITIGTDAVRWTSPGFVSTLTWEAVRAVVADERQLILFLSRCEVLPIPRRALESEEAFAALVRFARERAPLEATGATRGL